MTRKLGSRDWLCQEQVPLSSEGLQTLSTCNRLSVRDAEICSIQIARHSSEDICECRGQTSTFANICGNDRQPSSKSLRGPLSSMISGLTRTICSCAALRSPDGLKTMSRMLTPTCGAAKPTPSSLHQTLHCQNLYHNGMRFIGNLMMPPDLAVLCASLQVTCKSPLNSVSKMAGLLAIGPEMTNWTICSHCLPCSSSLPACFTLLLEGSALSTILHTLGQAARCVKFPSMLMFAQARAGWPRFAVFESKFAFRVSPAALSLIQPCDAAAHCLPTPPAMLPRKTAHDSEQACNPQRLKVSCSCPHLKRPSRCLIMLPRLVTFVAPTRPDKKIRHNRWLPNHDRILMSMLVQEALGRRPATT